MEINRDKLIKIIEAMLDTAHVFECELVLYQVIVRMLCREHGVGPERMQEIVDKIRASIESEIKTKYGVSHRDLLAKVPKLVDLLNSNQDEFARILKEWTPKGPPN
jgi:hypothetical protein